MDPTLVMSAASALAYAAQPVSGAVLPLDISGRPSAIQEIRIIAPIIKLTPLATEVAPELEAVIYSSMGREFERRYSL